MAFIELFLESCSFYNIIVIYHPPDDGFYKTETWSGVNTNKGFNTILSCVENIHTDFVKIHKNGMQVVLPSVNSLIFN